MEADDIVRAVRDVVSRAPADVLATYLYGSRGRGDARPTSDVDLAILLASDPPRTLANVASDLEAAVEREVGLPAEVVVMNTASADLVHRVRRDSVVLLDRDRPARLAFEVQSRNEYFDLEPIRPPALASTMRDMAGFRNVVVHGYQSVDLGILEDVLRNRLDDLLAFVEAMRRPPIRR